MDLTKPIGEKGDDRLKDEWVMVLDQRFVLHGTRCSECFGGLAGRGCETDERAAIDGASTPEMAVER
jgi:hypothetical protein